MAKKINIKILSDAELNKLVADTKVDLREHRFAAAGARPKDTNAARKGRKVVARVLTEQKARAK